MVNNSSNISTTQSLDRLVGTAAIIGLSLAVVLQWLTTSSDENDVLSEEEEGSNHPQRLQQEYERDNAAAAASPSRRKIIDGNKKSSWWWPLTIIQRRKKKRRKRQTNKHHENNNNPRNHLDGSYCNTNEGSSSFNEGYCDHLGSCKCGSIRFILKGPKHLQPIQSPGKIQYPHIQTSANNFHLVQGEADMRFQYVQESNTDEDYDNNNNNNNTTSGNNHHHHGDDSSTIATEQHNERQYHHQASSMGAHVFCGNCGVHVMHADRSSEELEVNANCLQQQYSSSSPVKEKNELQQQQLQQQQRQIQQQTSSLSSLSEGDTANDPTTSIRPQQLNSVSEHELFLGSAQFLMELDDNNHSNTSVDNSTTKCQELENSQHARTESISSTGEQTHPESYTTMLDTPTYEGDDYSMDGSSSLVAPAGVGGGGGASSSASVLSVNTAAGLLPPLPPSRLPPLSSSSDSKSVRTLPPWFGERPGYASHPSRSVGGGWSVASMETNDLDSVGGGGGNDEPTTVSPRMRDQMKFYMSRYMKDKKKSERSGSV